MKMIAGFAIGVVACMLAMWGISSQTQAAGDSTAVTDETDLSSLLPDITAIYDQALALPYQQVQSEITDPSIAAFYARYMEATGLNIVGGK